MKLTKQLINRFNNPKIEVREMNGTFKKATATVTYANGWEYRVEVDRTHPTMKQFNEDRKPIFVYPESRSSGQVLEVPDELVWVADYLYDLAETTDEEAEEMLHTLCKSMNNFYSEMGFT